MHNGIHSDFVVCKFIALRLNKDPSFYEGTLYFLYLQDGGWRAGVWEAQ